MSMSNKNLFPGLIFFVLFSLFSLVETAKASFDESPVPAVLSQAAEAPSLPEFEEQFYDYMFSQKYTQLLGVDRGACAYSIDPTDVHAQGTTRFVTAVVTGSDWGTGCRGYLAFQVFQADCEDKTLYTIEKREGDRRFSGWERLPMTLAIDDRNPEFETSLDVIEQPPAEAICSLPVAE